jgi:hypothetical protein
MYKTKNFTIYELVHPRIINSIGEHLAWQRLDALCLMDLDLIRERWGSVIYINTGKYDSRGLRPPNDDDGAMYSLHKQGKAFDLVPKNGDVKGLWEMVFDMVQNNELRTINTLESLAFTPTWVHIANCNTSDRPLVINP